ncbi:hypothetical protein D6D17_02794 [Aureobasidium pullulans]|nr:hypothetical protein D6D17_02794 [Aureobasidium pullulans]
MENPVLVVQRPLSQERPRFASPTFRSSNHDFMSSYNKTFSTRQGGWNPETGEFYKEINAQIDQAFDNCELNLRHAGGQGWSQVVRVNSYHVPINNEALDAMVRNFKKWMPNHQPIWTCVGVPRLGEDDMRVEIEVVAVDEDGKPIATQK